MTTEFQLLVGVAGVILAALITPVILELKKGKR
jgi:hypothetical protein